MKPLFLKRSQYFAIDKAEILRLNSNYFTALNMNDLATLAAIWLDSPDCLCHFSDTNDLLSGYDNIIAYFETIIPSKAQSEIIDVKLQFMVSVYHIFH